MTELRLERMFRALTELDRQTTLGRPTMISEVLDSPGLAELTVEVEERLTALLDEVAG